MASVSNVDLAQQADRHLWGHFSSLGRSVDGMPIIERGEGCYVWDNHGNRFLDGLAGLYTTQVGLRPGRARSCRGCSGRGARLLSDLDLRPSQGRGAGRPPGGLGPRRPQPGVLHQRRLGGGGVGLEAGSPVLQDEGRAPSHQGDLALSRLPRHHDGGPVDHRHLGAEGTVRTPDRRGHQGPQHQQLSPSRRGGSTRATSPRKSSRRSCERARRRSRRSSSSRFRTPVVASPRPMATSRGSARSATSTVCCSFPMKSFAPTVGSATGSAVERLGYQPDIITSAKGITSGYAPLGAMLVSDRIAEPFARHRRALPPRLHVRRSSGELCSCARQPRSVRRATSILGNVLEQRGRVPCLSRRPERSPHRGRHDAGWGTSTASNW